MITDNYVHDKAPSSETRYSRFKSRQLQKNTILAYQASVLTRVLWIREELASQIKLFLPGSLSFDPIHFLRILNLSLAESIWESSRESSRLFLK